MISFRIGWFDLLSVQGTLKSLLQHHDLKASCIIIPGDLKNLLLDRCRFSIFTLILSLDKTTLGLLSSGRCREHRHGGSQMLTNNLRSIQFSSVQLLSRVRLFVTPRIAARQASLSITNSRSSLKHTSIESVMPSSHLILCPPLLLLPPIPPRIRVFSNESTRRMRWPKYWSFSFSIIPSKEHPGLICFRMDCLDLLAVQETIKSVLQHHSSKASILQHSAFFTVQLSHPYMTTGKTIALIRWTFVGKVELSNSGNLGPFVITCHLFLLPLGSS